MKLALLIPVAVAAVGAAALQTTVAIDVGAIMSALAQPLTIITTAVVAWFAWRRTKRGELAARAQAKVDADLATKVTHDKLDGVHVLVNDQLTHEKSGRLSLMKANRVVLERLTRVKRGAQEKTLLENIDAQIADLETEIKKRNDAAATLTEAQK